MIRAEYIDHMGDDNRVTDAARVSFAKSSENFSDEANERLIHYLAKHNHWTPFSHPQITLRETVPIFVSNQRFKHCVGFTYNSVSRRYVDSPPQFYVSDGWRQRPEGGIKQGSSGDHPHSKAIHERYCALMANAKSVYRDMIADGVAPEQARMLLPQSMLTSYFVTGSLAAFARAYLLRIDSHAQKEIQALAQQWDAIIRPLFPISWSALTGGEA